ncbi:MAG: hypothetical protein LKJ31_06300 [Atopobiaceae bacterium]|jgi:hypothetical protein|nr:hypothetical protein [Atopobiaceae bacterium]
MMPFKKQRENTAKIEAEKALDRIPTSDGRIHIMLFRSFGNTYRGMTFGPDPKYNDQMNAILNEMQDRGLTILDVKVMPSDEKGLGGAQQFITLITYK